MLSGSETACRGYESAQKGIDTDCRDRDSATRVS
jgi:hypothetical protein